MLVLENRDGHYRLLGEGIGRYYSVRQVPVSVGVLWMPWACTWPGVSCPHRYADVLLAAPGTERIELARLPNERSPRDLDAANWRDLTTVDGYAVLDMGGALWNDIARFDGVLAPYLNWSVSGAMKPS